MSAAASPAWRSLLCVSAQLQVILRLGEIAGIGQSSDTLQLATIRGTYFLLLKFQHFAPLQAGFASGANVLWKQTKSYVCVAALTSWHAHKGLLTGFPHKPRRPVFLAGRRQNEAVGVCKCVVRLRQNKEFLSKAARNAFACSAVRTTVHL